MVLHPSAYESYEGFLKAAIERFWQSEGEVSVDALALLLSSREAWELVLDKAAAAVSLRKVLAGAAGATAVTLLLRRVLAGPLGLALTGASVASLGALLAKHQAQVRERSRTYRRLVTRYRSDFENLLEDYGTQRLRRDQRDLMVEGLFSRMLGELSAARDEVDVDDTPSGPPHASDAPENRDNADDRNANGKGHPH